VKLGVASSSCGNFITPRGPLVLSRAGSAVVAVSLGPGTGRVLGVGVLRGISEESAQVAATFSRLKGVLPGADKQRRSLMSKVQDLLISMVHSDTPKEGSSAGACMAFALLQVLGMDLQRIVAITATLDLRGRIGPVDDLMEKVQVAQGHQVRCALLFRWPVGPASRRFIRRVDPF
jgi:ATP-dependent Lon protease